MKNKTYKIGTLIETKDGFRTILGLAQFKDRVEYITASGNVEPKEVHAAYTRIDKVEAKPKKARKPKAEKVEPAKSEEVDTIEADPFAE